MVYATHFVLCYSRGQDNLQASDTSLSCRKTACPLQTGHQAKGSQTEYPFPYLWQCPGSPFQTRSSLLHRSFCRFVLKELQERFEDNDRPISSSIIFWTTTSLKESKVHSTYLWKNTHYFCSMFQKRLFIDREYYQGLWQHWWRYRNVHPDDETTLWQAYTSWMESA